MTTSEQAIQDLERRTRELTPGEEPGMKVGDYVREPSIERNDDGTVDWKPGLIVTDLQSAGWTWIYNTKTREPSLCNNNMLPTQLKLKNPDKTFVFTTQKPSRPPWRGKIKCFLHADRPEFAQFADMGLIPQSGSCRKQTIPNEFQLINHMRNKHPQEWAAISKERDDTERREEREERQAILRQLATSATTDTPSRTRKPMTEEQKEKARDNLAKARAARKKN